MADHQDSRLTRLASFLLDEGRTEFRDQCPPEGNAPASSSSLGSHFSEPASSSPAHEAQIANCLINGRKASVNAWRWEVQRGDIALLGIERLHQVMHALNHAEGHFFDLRLPKSKLASLVLEHCMSTVQSIVRQGSLRFKVGVTSDPFRRWFDADYGYAVDGVYAQMWIMTIVRTMEAAGFIEAALIREFKTCGACDNWASGGEGVSLEGSLAFVYVVLSKAPKKQKLAVSSP